MEFLEKFINNKNKGFTLIELLATIVILGILVLITTPVITNIINNARKNTFKNSAYGIVQAANQYYLNSKLTGESFEELTFTVNDNKLMSENKELSFSGKSPIGSSYVKINSSGEIAMNITDGTYYATKEYDETGVLITGEEEKAITREELANKVIELEEIVYSLTNINNSENVFLKTYPIGSIYISTVDTNPSEIYGGTWERYANGKTLVGVSEEETEFATVNKTGGEKKQLLSIDEIPTHNHEFVSNTVVATGDHKHFSPVVELRVNSSWKAGLTARFGKYSYPSAYQFTNYLTHWTGTDVYNFLTDGTTSSDANIVRNLFTSSAMTGGTPENLIGGTTTIEGLIMENGNNQPHNNLQPYITVYMWKRIS